MAIPTILNLLGDKRLGPLDNAIRTLNIIKHISTDSPAVGPDGLQSGDHPNPARPPRLPATCPALPVRRVDRNTFKDADQALLVHDLGDRDPRQELGGDADVLQRVCVVLPAGGDGLILDVVSIPGDGAAFFLWSYQKGPVVSVSSRCHYLSLAGSRILELKSANLRSSTLATWVDGDIKSFLVSGHFEAGRSMIITWRSKTKDGVAVQQKVADELYNL